jgi:hypothetical protein
VNITVNITVRILDILNVSSIVLLKLIYFCEKQCGQNNKKPIRIENMQIKIQNNIEIYNMFLKQKQESEQLNRQINPGMDLSEIQLED